jgi:hypothetical protein
MYVLPDDVALAQSSIRTLQIASVHLAANVLFPSVLIMERRSSDRIKRCVGRGFNHLILNRIGTTKDNSLVCTWLGGFGIGWARFSIASDS